MRPSDADPIALLRDNFTATDVRYVCENFRPRAAVGLCYYFAKATGDGKRIRDESAYMKLPTVLRAMGGAEDHLGHFWPMYGRGGVNDGSQQERLTMLAFMATWMEDKR